MLHFHKCNLLLIRVIYISCVRKHDHTQQLKVNASMCSNEQRSSSGRSGLHIRGRLRQQPHTDLPSRWNISSGIRMLGIRGWRVQGTGRDRRHVQWQHSSMRQREPPHSSFLNASPTNRFVTLTKAFYTKNLKLLSDLETVNLKYCLCISNTLFLKNLLILLHFLCQFINWKCK